MTGLRANAAWALAGTVGYTACQWLVLICLAKLGSAADVGRFALGLALAAPVMMLANLHLRAIQATDARAEHPFGVYLGLRLLTTLIAIAAVAAIAIGLGYRGATLGVILLVTLAKGFEAVSDVIFGLLQHAERLRRVAASMLAKGILSALAVAAVLRLTQSLVVATAALAACWGALLVAYDLPAARRLASVRPVVGAAGLGRLLWIALPMGCVMSLDSLAANVPRYAIEAHLGPTALGHFAALAYLLVAGSQPVLALGAAVSPRLARYFAADRAAYARLCRRLVMAAAGLAGVAVVAAAVGGAPLLARTYAPEYATHARLLVWLAVAGGAGWVASALGYAVTAARRFREQLGAAALALVVCALASHALVPRHGLVGAAWALLASAGVRLACFTVIYVTTAARAEVRPRSLALPGMSPGEVPSRA